MQPIEFDVTKQLDTFNKLASSMTFIVSKALNDVAFNNARSDVSKEIHKNMEVRNKAFSAKNSIRIKRSTKDSLEVMLYHFKEEMGLQQFGGVEKAKSKKLAIPIRKNLSRYANIAHTAKIPKNLSIDEIMKNAPRKRGEKIYRVGDGIDPFILKRGVFIRTDDGIRMLYVFADQAQHKKRLLEFKRVIERTYNVKLEKNIERNYLKLLKG